MKKEKRERTARYRCMLLLCAVPCMLLSGCGSSEELHVTIFDAQTETRMIARAGITVAQALGEAEITVGQEDRIFPALDTELSEDGTDIIIDRCAAVTVIENGKPHAVELTGAKVKDAVSGAAITLGVYDVVSHDLEAYLTDGMEIQIQRRHAVNILVDGGQQEYITQADTVAALLEEQKITLGKKDKVTPGLLHALQDGMQVVVKRVSVRKISEYEPIPYETKIEYSSSMEQGKSIEKQQGEDGEKELIYKVSYIDGKEDSRTLVKEKVRKEPVDHIIVKGTAVPQKTAPPAPSAPSAPSGRRIISRQPIYDCDGSGHGYYIITWSDGTVEYQDF